METINLNLIPGKDIPIVNVSQGDSGRVFKANLFDGDSVYTIPENYIVNAMVLTTDHEILEISIENTQDSYVDITIPDEITAKSGVAMCKMRVKDDAEHPLYDVGFSTFFINVEAQP